MSVRDWWRFSACGYEIGGDVVLVGTRLVEMCLWVRDWWRFSACGYVIGGDVVLVGT